MDKQEDKQVSSKQDLTIQDTYTVVGYDSCVCCGAPVLEGYMVCKECESKVNEKSIKYNSKNRKK